MRVVDRHEIDTAFAAEQVDTLRPGVESMLASLEQYAEAFNLLLTTALMVADYRCALDPAAEQGPTWESITLPMQVSTAMFAAANRTVECTIGVKTMQIKATGQQYWTEAGNWLTAYYLAMTCRERERLDLLSATPVELLKTRGNPYAPYDYAWIETLQKVWRREPGSYEKLLEAIAGTDPATIPTEQHEFVLFRLYPPMKMLGFLLSNEPDNFNDALFEALELHRRYWTGTPERARTPDGFIALGILAIISLAKEMGVSIDVESPYIPSQLVRGAWIGEFRT
jgi:hypothetical protein